MMTLKHILVAGHLSGEFVHFLLAADRHTNKCRDVFAHPLAVDQSLIALDDSVRLELSHPL
jgi:hypothetical protein